MRKTAVLLGILLAGCASQEKVRYIGPGGLYGSGSIAMSGTLSNGVFTISDHQDTCSGTFKSWQDLTITFPVRCTAGGKGSVTLTRPFSGPVSATGVLMLQNGQTRQIVYGVAVH